ncbi:hypothetical protein PRIC1_007087 [Phytophthora ramorum]|uniref:uncharacterized protein n=1 Tax=Phytophthora ramorum TaxID=164328 RepID=UPI0030AA7227|nr:hypothetical protein KRP23_2699 [Phytophthora ramorum]KAH7501962.1 hypothetical protein KRP22_7436 [Phytophthora ramorum]
MLSWLVESATKWTNAAHGAANTISHPNRDVTELVEQYRAERDAFDAEQCDESDEDEDAEGNAASAAARPTAAKPWSVKVFYQLVRTQLGWDRSLKKDQNALNKPLPDFHLQEKLYGNAGCCSTPPGIRYDVEEEQTEAMAIFAYASQS